MNFPFANSWLILGGGVVLWFMAVSTIARKGRFDPDSSVTFARFLSVLGIAAIILGLYAGLKGPLSVGSITLKPFSFAGRIGKGAALALRYARFNATISRQPAHGWHGGSSKRLQYTVTNNGNRRLTSILVRFFTRGGASYVDMKVYGPFPAGKTARAIVTVPEDAQRFYFERTSQVDSRHLVGASF